MTNLEFYKDEIYEIQRDLFEKQDICIAYGIGMAICKVYTKYTGLNAFMPMLLDWLLEEHRERIKLKKWEKDLLDCTFNKSLDFKDYRDLLEMKHRGYFKGISDTDMKLGEILENCEVIEK